MNQSRQKKVYKIGQAARELGLETYVLRYWETEFSQLEPCRSSTGHRFYTDDHLDILKRIKHLLYEDRLTIEGARQKLAESERISGILSEITAELLCIRQILTHNYD